MKKYILSLILVPFCIYAQNTPPVGYIVKSLKVDDGYQSFLKLNSSSISNINQIGWDVAFYSDVHEIGGKINDAKGVKLWRIFKDTTNFLSTTLADTGSNQFYNNDSFAYLGALDTIYTGSTTLFFNIGIGKFYTDPSYSAVPNRFFIIKKSDGSFGKFYVSYINRIFTIRYANIDNSGDKTINITKQPEKNLQYKYINFSTSDTTGAFEPQKFDWDLVFRKYFKGNKEQPLGIMTNNSYNLIRFSNVAGLPVDYLKYGIVSTECYEVLGDPSTVTYNGSLSTMEPISRLNNQIADKWLNTSTQQPIINKSYYLRDKGGNLWHLVFTTYNATTNTIEIAYKDKGNVASIQSKLINSEFSIYQQNQSLIIESNADISSEKQIQLFDLSGKIIKSSKFKNSIELNVSEFQNSIIFVKIISNKTSHSYKYLVK